MTVPAPLTAKRQETSAPAGVLASARRALAGSIRCRICWRVTMCVFSIVLVTEVSIQVPSALRREADALERLAWKRGVELDAELANAGADPDDAGIAAIAARLDRRGWRAIDIRSSDGHLLASSGDPAPHTTPGNSLRSGGASIAMTTDGDGEKLDATWQRTVGGRPVLISGRFDASAIGRDRVPALLRIAGIIALVGAAVTIGTLAVLQVLLLRPLLRLNASTRGAADNAGRATAYAIRIQRSDEVGEIIAAHNEMLRRVEESVRSERNIALERERHLSHYDPVSGMPNRRALLHYLTTRGAHERMALILAKIVRLHDVNSAYGHETGDVIIRETGSRMRDAAGNGWFVAHLGGGRFAVAFDCGTEAADGAAVAERLVLKCRCSYLVEEKKNEVEATIRAGIVRSVDGPASPREMLTRAELALAKASEERVPYAFYARELAEESRCRQLIAKVLERALREPGDGIRLAFQPLAVVAAGSVSISGAEALVRVRGPNDEDMPPARFIPIAESTGLIMPLGERVLWAACAQAAAWHRILGEHFRVSVNLSAHQFAEVGLVDTITRAIDSSGASAKSLEIEITESVAMRDIRTTVAIIGALRSIGLTLAMDDFGTGYSSLGVLRRLEVDAIKIDRTFIADIGRDSQADALCAAIIRMAHALGKRVIAEGVESREQLDFLSFHGCREFQGYLFGRPMAPADFESHFLSNPVGSPD